MIALEAVFLVVASLCGLIYIAEWVVNFYVPVKRALDMRKLDK
jgi:hypothetical protein